MNKASRLSSTERLLSILGGSYLIYNTIAKEKNSIIKGVAAGYLLFRGATGYCPVSERFGKDEVDQVDDINISTSMRVQKPHNEVYNLWRNLENLPLFMEHLKEVKKIDDTLSEWTVQTPAHIGSVSWKSEIVEDKKGEKLGWQSVEGSMIRNSGTVRFHKIDESYTEVSVIMSYQAPMGKAGQDVAKLLNPVFKNMIRKDIQDFKQFVESGKIEQEKLKSKV